MEVPVSFAVRVAVGGMSQTQGEQSTDQQVEACNRHNQQLKLPRVSGLEVHSLHFLRNQSLVRFPSAVLITGLRMLSKLRQPVN